MPNAARAWIRLCALLLLAAAAGVASANGGGLRASFFSSWWGSAKVPLKATVELDPVMFWSTTVDGKYRLLRVVLENAADAPAVVFSKDADTFSILGERKVRGILDVGSVVDGATWDALPPSVREAMLYPAELKPNAAVAIYVLVPVQDLTKEPIGFDFAVKSLPRPLEIRKKPATKA